MGVLKEMGIELTKKQVTELYFVLDRDGDGEIDTKELLRG
jgi:Ca2+-binding EF-hand superfamily protein